MGGSISEENTRLPITISKDLKERAAFVAKCEHRSLSNLIIATLSAYVDQHYSFYDLLFEQDGKEKSKINTEKLKDISNKMFIHGVAGTGKSAMLDQLLNNMYHNELNQMNDNKSDTK